MPDQTPSIGETIDDDKPSKARQFISDPKNMATMLVLASALAQPRDRGQTALAHGLQSGVGALGFRGALNEGIEEQAQQSAESASLIQGRESTAAIGQERNILAGQQIESTIRGQDIGQSEGALDRTSLESIADTRLEAEQVRFQNEVFKAGVDAYLKAIAVSVELGGPVPNPEDYFVVPSGHTGGIERPGDDGPAVVEDPDAPAIIATEGAVVNPSEKAQSFGPRIIQGVPIPSYSPMSDNASEEGVTRAVSKSARRKFPEQYGSLSDAEIFAKIQGIQETARAALIAGMSENDAKLYTQDRVLFAQLTKEQQTEIRKIARGPHKT